MPLTLTTWVRKGNKRLSWNDMDQNLLDIENTLNFLGLYDLYDIGDPGEDAILGWDDSAGAGELFTFGDGITTNDTEIIFDTVWGDARYAELSGATFTGDVDAANGAIYVTRSTDDYSAFYARIGATNYLVAGKFPGSNDAYIKAPQGHVQLQSGATTRLSTTPTGIDVTGAVVAHTDSGVAVVGTTAPAGSDARFQAVLTGTGAWYFGLDATDNKFKFDWNSSDFSSPTLMLSPTAGEPGTDDAINWGSLTFRFNDIFATNGTIQTSDAKKKRDVLDTTLSLDFIKGLRPVSYKWKDTVIPAHEEEHEDENGKKTKVQVAEKIIKHTRPHQGLIAQEVKAAMDKLGIADFAGFIHDPETDSYGLRYHEFIGPMIKAIQELSVKINFLEKELKLFK